MPTPSKSDIKRSSAISVAFHSHFASIYGSERWHKTLYPALLERHQHCALINVFADDPQRHGGKMELGCHIQDEYTVPARSGRYLSHYNLDPASLLPTHALDPQPGELILDLCAAPGGKTIALAQHATVHANEFDNARHRRLTANLKDYLPPDRYKLWKLDGTKASFQQYDKILVDAPCSSERHLIHSQTMDWKLSKTLPKTQVALLQTALKAVKPGGRVVYATCSLSVSENDDVIEKAMQKVAFEVVDDPFYDSMTEQTKYGRLALPDHESGRKWGPIYFSVLIKRSPPP